MPGDMRSLLAAQRRAVEAGRNAGKGRLLSNGDLNVGNSQIIKTVGPPIKIVPDLDPPRILNLDAQSDTGQLVTVSIGAVGMNQGDFGASPMPGLITGIIEFGNGSVFTKLELDVPLGPIDFASTLNANPKQPSLGGVLITVPAGTLRVYARSDANYITPTIIGLIGLPLAGALPPNAGGLAVDVVVTAFAAYYTRPGNGAGPTKTLFLGRAPAAGINWAINTTYNIPAYAKTIKFLRPRANIVDFTISDAAGNTVEQHIIAAGTDSPVFPLYGYAKYFTIGGTSSPAIVGQVMAAVFDLGI